jgi:hypothetical protein
VKWYKPISTIQNEIQEPIQRIAMVAFAALTIAVLALFIALGKE